MQSKNISSNKLNYHILRFHFSKQLIFWCTDFKATTSTEMLPWSIKVTFMNLNSQGVMCRAVPGHHCATALLQCSHTCEIRVASEGKKRYKRAISHSELRGRGRKLEEEALLAMPTISVPT